MLIVLMSVEVLHSKKEQFIGKQLKQLGELDKLILPLKAEQLQLPLVMKEELQVNLMSLVQEWLAKPSNSTAGLEEALKFQAFNDQA